MEILDLYKRLDALDHEKNTLEEKLKEAITKAIYEAASGNPNKPKKISEHIFVVKYSGLIGNPWNVEFYNWEYAAKILLEHLKKSNVRKWKTIIEEVYDKRQGTVAFINFKEQIWFNMYRTKKTTIPADFVKMIIDKI